MASFIFPYLRASSRLKRTDVAGHRKLLNITIAVHPIISLFTNQEFWGAVWRPGFSFFLHRELKSPRMPKIAWGFQVAASCSSHCTPNKIRIARNDIGTWNMMLVFLSFPRKSKDGRLDQTNLKFFSGLSISNAKSAPNFQTHTYVYSFLLV